MNSRSQQKKKPEKFEMPNNDCVANKTTDHKKIARIIFYIILTLLFLYGIYWLCTRIFGLSLKLPFSTGSIEIEKNVGGKIQENLTLITTPIFQPSNAQQLNPTHSNSPINETLEYSLLNIIQNFKD